MKVIRVGVTTDQAGAGRVSPDDGRWPGDKETRTPRGPAGAERLK